MVAVLSCRICPQLHVATGIFSVAAPIPKICPTAWCLTVPRDLKLFVIKTKANLYDAAIRATRPPGI